MQPEIRSFVSVLRSDVTPFDRSKSKNANCFEERNVFANGKCELSAIYEGRNQGANFWQGKVQKLSANTENSSLFYILITVLNS